MATWLDDLKGKIIRSADLTMPNRKFLRFNGPGVSVSDNPAQNTTDVTVTPLDASGTVLSVFGRQGDVRAQFGDYTASLVEFDPSTSDLTSTNCQDAIVESYNTLVDRINEARLNFPIINHAPGYGISSADLGNAFRGGDIQVVDGGTFEVGSVIPLIRNDDDGMTVTSPVEAILVPEHAQPSLRQNNSTATLLKVSPSAWVLTGDLWKPNNLARGWLFSATAVSNNGLFNITGLTTNGDSWNLTGTNTLYPPRRGMYFVSLMARVAGPNLNEFIEMSVVDDADVEYFKAGQTVRSSGAQTSFALNGLVEITDPGNQGISFKNTTGSTLTTDSDTALNSFSIHYIGDLASTVPV